MYIDVYIFVLSLLLLFAIYVIDFTTKKVRLLWNLNQCRCERVILEAIIPHMETDAEDTLLNNVHMQVQLEQIDIEIHLLRSDLVRMRKENALLKKKILCLENNHGLHVELSREFSHLQKKLDLVYYAPGMPGYLEAKESYDYESSHLTSR